MQRTKRNTDGIEQTRAGQNSCTYTVYSTRFTCIIILLYYVYRKIVEETSAVFTHAIRTWCRGLCQRTNEVNLNPPPRARTTDLSPRRFLLLFLRRLTTTTSFSTSSTNTVPYTRNTTTTIIGTYSILTIYTWVLFTTISFHLPYMKRTRNYNTIAVIGRNICNSN